jgi:hypothetical protein
MFNERFAIQQRMTEIKDERRALHDEYYKLLDRLREVDKDSAQSEGFTADYAKLSEELANAVQAVANLVPAVTVSQVIDNIKQENETLVESLVAEAEPKRTEVQERVHKEVRKARVAIEASDKQEMALKPSKAMPIILAILKEEGIPLSPTAIRAKFTEKGYTMRTAIHEVIRRLNLDGKIESPAYGFWQPKRNEAAATIE